MDKVTTYYAYSAAWNEPTDRERRNELLKQSWADDGAFFDEETPDGIVGRPALSAYIAATHEEMPGLVVAETSGPQVLGDRLRVGWVARQDGIEPYTGTDFVEFAGDGRIIRVTMFYDSTPDSDPS